MNGHQSAKGLQPLTMNHSDADTIIPDCSITPDLPHALVKQGEGAEAEARGHSVHSCSRKAGKNLGF